VANQKPPGNGTTELDGGDTSAGSDMEGKTSSPPRDQTPSGMSLRVTKTAQSLIDVSERSAKPVCMDGTQGVVGQPCASCKAAQAPDVLKGVTVGGPADDGLVGDVAGTPGVVVGGPVGVVDGPVMMGCTGVHPDRVMVAPRSATITAR